MECNVWKTRAVKLSFILGYHDHRPVLLLVACHHWQGFSVSPCWCQKLNVSSIGPHTQTMLYYMKKIHTMPFWHLHHILVMTKEIFQLLSTHFHDIDGITAHLRPTPLPSLTILASLAFNCLVLEPHDGLVYDVVDGHCWIFQHNMPTAAVH